MSASLIIGAMLSPGWPCAPKMVVTYFAVNKWMPWISLLFRTQIVAIMQSNSKSIVFKHDLKKLSQNWLETGDFATCWWLPSWPDFAMASMIKTCVRRSFRGFSVMLEAMTTLITWVIWYHGLRSIMCGFYTPKLRNLVDLCISMNCQMQDLCHSWVTKIFGKSTT